MTRLFNGDFARLIPRNQVAQTLYSATRMYVDEHQTFHLRFLQSNAEKIPIEPVEAASEYDTMKEDEQLHTDCYVLSFTEEREPELPKLGWRVGRGTQKIPTNRGVDFLLSAPGHALSKSLAAIHLVFVFNRRSGLLMLKGGSPKVVTKYRLGDKWIHLGFGEEFLIFESLIRIRAGACEYDLEHIINDDQRELYFVARDRFLMGGDVKMLTKPLQKMPGDKYVSRGQYLELETRGSGTFGWITQGLDTKTGDVVAIKEVRIDAKTKAEVIAEVKIGTRFTVRTIQSGKCNVFDKFQNEHGLLPTLDTMCEHDHSEICCDLERFYIIMPLALQDFTGSLWQREEISWSTKLQLLKEPLEGIKNLHAMGILHRDIRLKNMLVLSYDPPHASLCDFGKAVEAKTAINTKIGPIYTLAPEVWTTAETGPYTAMIDTWAYGYAIAEILGYKPSDYSKITPERLATILQTLEAIDGKETPVKALVDLVSKLLVWNPQNRWSADQALHHVCWLSIARKEDRTHDETAENRKEKKVSVNDSRIDLYCK